MAHSLSAKKRIRQNVKRRALNRARKAQIKQVTRTVDEAAAGGDVGKTTEALRAAVKKIDQVAAKGAIHKNTAARKKAALQRKLNALQTKS